MFENIIVNMENIITFNKSFQQRLLEFDEVLSNSLPAADIQRNWASFLEVTVDKVGWQAIWKIPRITCKSLNIPFPSCALVIVLTLNSKELKAYVRTLAVQSNINVPKKIWVPLIQLWPTLNQDKTIVLDLLNTANSLDMLRFFYLHIYMPWDRDEDDIKDWKEKHLESRLRFYYDLKNGNIPRLVAEQIHNLLTEARRLQHKRELIEEEIRREEENSNDFDVDALKDTRTKTLMKIHVRLLEIRTDIEIAEDPLLRTIIIERFSKLDDVSHNLDSQTWLVSSGGKADEHIDFLTKVKTLFPNETLKFCSSFASKLESGNKNDKYLLNENTHKILKTGVLEEGGFVMGIGNKENVILKYDDEDVMLNFMGEKVEFENLTIDIGRGQCGIVVRKGTCHLRHCKLIGTSSSSISQGIIVLKEAYLILENCEISGFSTGIVGNSGSNIKIFYSNIYNANIGIKIFDESYVTLESSSIKDCSDFGIHLETENKTENILNFGCLEKVQEINCTNVAGDNNTRGDVAILQRPKLNPFDDLFTDPDNDPTIIESDDEEINMTL